MAARIQRRRTKGWRAADHTTSPLGARYVGRGTRWGNPWVVVRTTSGTGWAVQWAGPTGSTPPVGLQPFAPAADQRDAHDLAVDLYRVTLLHDRRLARQVPDLAGYDLLCWCREPLPCHVDVLLELANTPTVEETR